MNANKLVASQALDEGLWFAARTAPEAYLQAALRELHAAIEAVQVEPSSERGTVHGTVPDFPTYVGGPGGSVNVAGTRYEGTYIPSSGSAMQASESAAGAAQPASAKPLAESFMRQAFKATKAAPISNGFNLFDWYQSGVYLAEAAHGIKDQP